MRKRPTVLDLLRRCSLLGPVVVLLCLSGGVFAQTFEKSFGGPKEDFGSAVIVTRDYGYLNVGSTEGLLGDDNDFDLFLVRTDVDGTVTWTRQIDEGFVEQGLDATEAADGSYLVVGYRQTEPGAPDQTYLVRVGRRGDLLLSRTYGEDGVPERGEQITTLANGEILLTGYRRGADADRDDILVQRIRPDGDVVWRASFGGARDQRGVAAVETPDGGLVVGALTDETFGSRTDIVLYGLDADGQQRWSKTYGRVGVNESIEDIILTRDGHLAFVGSTENTNKALVAKADLNGDTLWYREFDASAFDDVLVGIVEEDNGEALVAVGETVPTQDNIDILMVKVRAQDGNPVYVRKLGEATATNRASGVSVTPDGGFAIAAATDIVFNDMSLFKTSNFGDLQTNYLQGRVYRPQGDDCGAYEDGDFGLAGWLVRAEGTTNTFFGTTDSLGRYELRVDQDIYSVSLLRRNDRWTLCSEDALTVDLTQPYDSSFHDFAVRPAVDCPLLEVSLSATPALRGGVQTLTLTYGNEGTATATGASIELTLADELGFDESNHPVTTDGNRLTFELGDLRPGDGGSIALTATVREDVLAGQAVSSEARIFPVVNCAPVEEDWDRSSIVVTSSCDPQDGITFTITNQGTQGMVNTGGYVIVEDIVLFSEGTYQLEANESQVITITENSDGRTYRMIAEQSAGHPGSRFPTAVEEGCTTGGAVEFTTGRVAQFPDNDGDLNLDILTQEIVVLDNGVDVQLAAYPRGYQDSIIIPKTDIEYTVFFTPPVNDSDSFERVVIRDTLPELLDFNSLEMGAASHPYDFVLQQGGVLKITFDSIRIFSGGGAGEAGAGPVQGYVSFRLSQKPNNLTGSVIRNRAAVYFEDETPVFTRATRHVVGCENFLSEDCLLVSTRRLPQRAGVTLHTFPNPATVRTTVRIHGWDRPGTAFELRLYDATGRLVRSQTFVGDQSEIVRHNLAAGAYHYEVSGGGYKIGSGNLILK